MALSLMCTSPPATGDKARGGHMTQARPIRLFLLGIESVKVGNGDTLMSEL